MRKQYHLWPGELGLDAWDVDRLIELTADLQIKQVALSTIEEIGSVYWFGDSGEPPTVRNVVQHIRLIQLTDLSYPVILGKDGRVMDGRHRIAKALLEGRSHIAAEHFNVHPGPDYRGWDPADLPHDG